jgi:hypothetical protein
VAKKPTVKTQPSDSLKKPRNRFSQKKGVKTAAKGTKDTAKKLVAIQPKRRENG